MFVFESIAPSGHDSERVSTAFYRFLEVHSATVSEADAASMTTEVIDGQVRRTINLWSEQALQDFRLFEKAFRVTPPSALFSRPSQPGDRADRLSGG
jgi:hypothetical protein